MQRSWASVLSDGEMAVERYLQAMDAGEPFDAVVMDLTVPGGMGGAEALAQMCKEMENLGRSDSTEGAAGILTDMEQEFQAVRDSLSAILEKEI